MLKELPRLSSQIQDKNPWWEYKKDTYLHPDGSEGEYYYIHTPGAAMMIPITDDGKIIMVRQYRYLNRRESLEFIGGGVKPGKSYEESAREELLEEAGVIAEELTRIGEYNPMNGATDEICNIFVAGSLKRTAMKPDVSEEFEVLEFDYTHICELIKDGSIWDGMTLAAFALFAQYKQNFIT